MYSPLVEHTETDIRITDYSKTLDTLYYVGKSITNKDVENFIAGKITPKYNDRYRYLQELNYSMETILYRHKIESKPRRYYNLMVLARHSIHELPTFIIGFRICNSSPTNGSRPSEGEICDMICNIDILFNNKHVLSMCNRGRYLTLCLIIYERSPLNTFYHEFAMYDGFEESDLWGEVTLDMIKAIQDKYRETKHMELLFMVNFLVRRHSSVCDDLLTTLELKHKINAFGIGDSRRFPKNLFDESSYTKTQQHRYTYRDLNRTYELLTKKTPAYTLEEKNEYLIEKAYLIIGSYLPNVLPAYKPIITDFQKNVFHKEIHIEDLHSKLMISRELKYYESLYAMLIHRSILKLEISTRYALGNFIDGFKLTSIFDALKFNN